MPRDEPSARGHRPFRFRTAEGLLRKAEALGLDLPFDREIDWLLHPTQIASRRVPNRMAVQPMEGVDSHPDGSPGELAFRRYRRYAEGGSGLIWFEATSVVPDGRSNPHALVLTRDTQPAFRALVDATRTAAEAAFGPAHRPFLVLQLTHAGRFSEPGGQHVIRGACANPHLDPPHAEIAMWRDDEIDALRDVFVDRIRLATEAGFDAVDVKACHGYLVSELLGAHTRTDSRYGGPFENRCRLLLDVVAGARDVVPDARIAVRLNGSDLVPHPYGFGMATDGSDSIDLAEPRALVRDLVACGCCLINVTAGVPRYASHIGRPFDRPVSGGAVPPEHPLIGEARLIGLADAIQQACAPVPVVGTGYSWLRQFWPNVGAAVLRRGMATFIGLGRGAFAYPDAPRDLMTRGAVDRKKCCTTCSRCTEMMHRGTMTGCVVHDRAVYPSSVAQGLQPKLAVSPEP
jgi:2,4-dienoyl-CoA reductase-like NADH-dependent reductase (Old Yellow Enzyme family)